MFKRTALLTTLTLTLISGGAAWRATAQEGTSKAPEADLQVTAYRLDFSINELESGKKINTRQYSMNLNTAEGRSADLKIGTRVPIELKEGETQYVDLGTNISARIQDHKGPVGLWVRAEISNLAAAEQSLGHDARPILRQFKIDGSTTWEQALLGRPMIMGSVDDPDSKRSFQLEVTLTKVK